MIDGSHPLITKSTTASREALEAGQGKADARVELEPYRAEARQLFRIGRIRLLIGVAFLGLAVAAAEWLAGLVRKESLVTGGWVARWRPLEIFLHGWWPILSGARLHDGLKVMDMRVLGTEENVSA